MNVDDLERCDKLAGRMLVKRVRRKLLPNNKVAYLGSIIAKNERGQAAGTKLAILVAHVGSDGLLRYGLSEHEKVQEIFLAMDFTILDAE